MKVVLDTNVILSAVLCGGNPGEYFVLAVSGKIQLFTSLFILNELQRILQKKFRWTDVQWRELKKWYGELAPIVEADDVPAIIRACPADNHILACAVAAEADLLVTGDKKHILPLKTYRGIRIVSPIEGLALLG